MQVDVSHEARVCTIDSVDGSSSLPSVKRWTKGEGFEARRSNRDSEGIETRRSINLPTTIRSRFLGP